MKRNSFGADSPLSLVEMRHINDEDAQQHREFSSFEGKSPLSPGSLLPLPTVANPADEDAFEVDLNQSLDPQTPFGNRSIDHRITHAAKATGLRLRTVFFISFLLGFFAFLAVVILVHTSYSGLVRDLGISSLQRSVAFLASTLEGQIQSFEHETEIGAYFYDTLEATMKMHYRIDEGEEQEMRFRGNKSSQGNISNVSTTTQQQNDTDSDSPIMKNFLDLLQYATSLEGEGDDEAAVVASCQNWINVSMFPSIEILRNADGQNNKSYSSTFEEVQSTRRTLMQNANKFTMACRLINALEESLCVHGSGVDQFSFHRKTEILVEKNFSLGGEGGINNGSSSSSSLQQQKVEKVSLPLLILNVTCQREHYGGISHFHDLNMLLGVFETVRKNYQLLASKSKQENSSNGNNDNGNLNTLGLLSNATSNSLLAQASINPLTRAIQFFHHAEAALFSHFSFLHDDDNNENKNNEELFLWWIFQVPSFEHLKGEVPADYYFSFHFPESTLASYVRSSFTEKVKHSVHLAGDSAEDNAEKLEVQAHFIVEQPTGATKTSESVSTARGDIHPLLDENEMKMPLEERTRLRKEIIEKFHTICGDGFHHTKHYPAILSLYDLHTFPKLSTETPDPVPHISKQSVGGFPLQYTMCVVFCSITVNDTASGDGGFTSVAQRTCNISDPDFPRLFALISVNTERLARGNVFQSMFIGAIVAVIIVLFLNIYFYSSIAVPTRYLRKKIVSTMTSEEWKQTKTEKYLYRILRPLWAGEIRYLIDTFYVLASLYRESQPFLPEHIRRQQLSKMGSKQNIAMMIKEAEEHEKLEMMDSSSSRSSSPHSTTGGGPPGGEFTVSPAVAALLDQADGMNFLQTAGAMQQSVGALTSLLPQLTPQTNASSVGFGEGVTPGSPLMGNDGENTKSFVMFPQESSQPTFGNSILDPEKQSGLPPLGQRRVSTQSPSLMTSIGTPDMNVKRKFSQSSPQLWKPAARGGGGIHTHVNAVDSLTLMVIDIGFVEAAYNFYFEGTARQHSQIISAILAVVRHYRGAIFTKRGDSIGVAWNAFEKQANHIFRGVDCAREISKRFKTIRNQGLHMGISLHTGPAIVGTLGDETYVMNVLFGKTLDFAISTADLALELDDCATMLISDPVKQAISNKYDCIIVDAVKEASQKHRYVTTGAVAINLYDILEEKQLVSGLVVAPKGKKKQVHYSPKEEEGADEATRTPNMEEREEKEKKSMESEGTGGIEDTDGGGGAANMLHGHKKRPPPINLPSSGAQSLLSPDSEGVSSSQSSSNQGIVTVKNSSPVVNYLMTYNSAFASFRHHKFSDTVEKIAHLKQVFGEDAYLKRLFLLAQFYSSEQHGGGGLMLPRPYARVLPHWEKYERNVVEATAQMDDGGDNPLGQAANFAELAIPDTKTTPMFVKSHSRQHTFREDLEEKISSTKMKHDKTKHPKTATILQESDSFAIFRSQIVEEGRKAGSPHRKTSSASPPTSSLLRDRDGSTCGFNQSQEEMDELGNSRNELWKKKGGDEEKIIEGEGKAKKKLEKVRSMEEVGKVPHHLDPEIMNDGKSEVETGEGQKEDQKEKGDEDNDNPSSDNQSAGILLLVDETVQTSPSHHHRHFQNRELQDVTVSASSSSTSPRPKKLHEGSSVKEEMEQKEKTAVGETKNTEQLHRPANGVKREEKEEKGEIVEGEKNDSPKETQQQGDAAANGYELCAWQMNLSMNSNKQKPTQSSTNEEISGKSFFSDTAGSMLGLQQSLAETVVGFNGFPTRVRSHGGNYYIRSEQKLGKGSYGCVFLGMEQHTAKFVAMKFLPLPSAEQSKLQIITEVEILAQVKDENIVEFHDYALTGGLIVLIMECVVPGTLADVLKNFKKLEAITVVNYMKDVLRGLHKLHSLDIIHRDIKPQNVLLTRTGQCKLTDFGGSASLALLARQEFANVVMGSPVYMAPEAARGNPEKKSDIWSVGIIFLELITGSLPYDLTEDMQANPVIFIYNLGSKLIEPKITPKKGSADWDQPTTEFVKGCIAWDPADRKSAEELLDLPFFM